MSQCPISNIISCSGALNEDPNLFTCIGDKYTNNTIDINNGYSFSVGLLENFNTTGSLYNNNIIIIGINTVAISSANSLMATIKGNNLSITDNVGTNGGISIVNSSLGCIYSNYINADGDI